ncbi:cystatin-B-like [Chiloscyllium punctatum]|uniref:cystatin-B-like n=1 Tax=Chiloscyllium punctatum TaxID=137246 RepID=UPI003B637F1B
MASVKLGGASDVAAVTSEIQDIVESLKSAVEQKLNRSLNVYRAISYRSQVVAGTNYFIKVAVGDPDECIHMRVYQPLVHTGESVSLVSIQTDKRLLDEIEYF